MDRQALEDNFEDFSFKFKSYLSLMNPGFTTIMNNIEADIAFPVSEDHFNDDAENVQAA